MKTIHFQVTFTGRVDDVFAAALEKAWARSETVANIPIRDVTLATSSDGSTFTTFDFCQPENLRIEPAA